MSTLAYDAALGVWGRRETHDFKSAHECVRLVKELDVQPQDIVLDVGGHIGAFARLCCLRGARTVTVEPDAANIDVLTRNVAEFGAQCVIWPVALSDHPPWVDAGEAVLWRNVPSSRTKLLHTGIHSLVKTRGRQPETVPVHSFRAALSHFRPTVLKVDIEGGEWLCDFAALPSEVRALHIEMHMQSRVVNGREKAPKLHDAILAQGFEVVVPPNFKKMWGTHPVYRRRHS